MEIEAHWPSRSKTPMPTPSGNARCLASPACPPQSPAGSARSSSRCSARGRSHRSRHAAAGAGLGGRGARSIRAGRTREGLGALDAKPVRAGRDHADFGSCRPGTRRPPAATRVMRASTPASPSAPAPTPPRGCACAGSPSAELAAGWDRVLDYGCGSGILAIGAALHGAQHIDAVDIDPAALSPRHGRQRGGQCHASSPRGRSAAAAGTYPLVLANILASPLAAGAAAVRPRRTWWAPGVGRHPGPPPMT